MSPSNCHAKEANEKDEGNSRHFVPLVDNEVHLIELSLGDRARWDQKTDTWCGEIVTKSMLTWLHLPDN